MSESSISRRSFLSRSAGAGAGLTLTGFPRTIRARDVNDRINVGIVGPGGRGTSILKEFFRGNKNFNAHLTAVCDLWSYRRDKAVELVKQEEGKAPRSTGTMRKSSTTRTWTLSSLPLRTTPTPRS